jgi:hypothetical protein
MASPNRGLCPWTKDGVPPLSNALRGGSLLYHSGRTVDRAAADAGFGTDKMGSGAIVRSTRGRDGPSEVQGQSPWPFLHFLRAQ